MKVKIVFALGIFSLYSTSALSMEPKKTRFRPFKCTEKIVGSKEQPDQKFNRFKDILRAAVLLEAENFLDETGLHLASSFGYLDNCRLLISLGVSVKAKDKSGSTALHLASAAGHIEVCRLLLESGALVEVRTGGLTPLHVAVSNGRLEVVKLLLEYKADVYAKTEDGRTVIDLAVQSGNKELIDFFKIHCKRFNTLLAAAARERSDLFKMVSWGNSKAVSDLLGRNTYTPKEIKAVFLMAQKINSHVIIGLLVTKGLIAVKDLTYIPEMECLN